MEIVYFDELESTQKYLVQSIKSGFYQTPICIVANNQTKGIGSKSNSWDGFDNNLFFSFSLSSDLLPTDLPSQSICIYLLYIFKQCLSDMGSNAVIKWPNDIYLHNKKICGAMTSIIKNNIVCGIGLNTDNSSQEYAVLDINIDKKLLLESYFKEIYNMPSWGLIFSKYEVEFNSQKEVFFGDLINQGQGVELMSDGSLNIDGTKVFGLR